MFNKIVAVTMSIIVVAITIVIALQNMATIPKTISLATMLFIDCLTIGGTIYTFRDK